MNAQNRHKTTINLNSGINALYKTIEEFIEQIKFCWSDCCQWKVSFHLEDILKFLNLSKTNYKNNRNLKKDIYLLFQVFIYCLHGFANKKTITRQQTIELVK